MTLTIERKRSAERRPVPVSPVPRRPTRRWVPWLALIVVVALAVGGVVWLGSVVEAEEEGPDLTVVWPQCWPLCAHEEALADWRALQTVLPGP